MENFRNLTGRSDRWARIVRRPNDNSREKLLRNMSASTVCLFYASSPSIIVYLSEFYYYFFLWGKICTSAAIGWQVFNDNRRQKTCPVLGMWKERTVCSFSPVLWLSEISAKSGVCRIVFTEGEFKLCFQRIPFT